MKKKIVLLSIISLIAVVSQAREGMWIPVLLEKNITEMHDMGFKLNAEDIYNLNHSSMKDAIVHFGGGCTGEVISPEGLLVTNYHCGYSNIQSHSSVKNDYLTNGYWAANRNEELPNQGLKVTFLIRMDEVTQQVIEGTGALTSQSLIDSLIDENKDKIIDSVETHTGYEAEIKPYFEGNQYYLLLTETFRDVRLVGAPPSSIGKFGGDSDNWMWPRHTGDFSLFRIYAGKDNKPADYSPDNVPYSPKSFFPINISGIHEGDFTMVFGYPGSTQQYLPSNEVDEIQNELDPDRVAIRELKLKILKQWMDRDDETRIKYAAKYASTSNSWKKWQGEVLGLKRLGTIEKKKVEEESFVNWVKGDSIRSRMYGTIIPEFEKLYKDYKPLAKEYTYYTECIFRGSDMFKNYQFVTSVLKEDGENDNKSRITEIDQLVKDYSPVVDCEVFVSLLSKYYNDLPKENLPKELIEFFNEKNPVERLRACYMKSILSKEDELKKIAGKDISSRQKKKITSDEIYILLDDLSRYFNEKVSVQYRSVDQKIDIVQKKYVKAQLEMRKGEMIYPDANSTLRVSYGKVEGFHSRDGVDYNFYTTLDGVMEKEDRTVDDYRVDDKLKVLYKNKDYGRYALSNGTMPVCFTASNHTTGGNSGSPVIDAKGNLIGINFDRCWEGTMSDIDFDPEKCRNISLDMRYMLFIIDKFANAGYLLSEMKIIE